MNACVENAAPVNPAKALSWEDGIKPPLRNPDGEFVATTHTEAGFVAASPDEIVDPENTFAEETARLGRRPLHGEEGSGSIVTPAAVVEKRSWFPTRWLGRDKARAAERSPHIVHVDVDAFFASVEQVLNPKLAGKPVLVGRGVVASASYEAKFRGVKTAMSFRDALRICPKAIVVPGQYEHYADFAERVRRILETYTPAVETAALDDFYLDFAGTERLYPDYEATLRRLQAEILGRTGLSVSVGAARTKVVASIASRLWHPAWKRASLRRCRWTNCTGSGTRTLERWRSAVSPPSGNCAWFRSRCWWPHLAT
jgi:hypothetical protein